MHTTKHRPKKIADEIRKIRNELRKIIISLHPQSDANQCAIADKKITELEKRVDELEARQKRTRS